MAYDQRALGAPERLKAWRSCRALPLRIARAYEICAHRSDHLAAFGGSTMACRRLASWHHHHGGVVLRGRLVASALSRIVARRAAASRYVIYLRH